MTVSPAGPIGTAAADAGGWAAPESPSGSGRAGTAADTGLDGDPAGARAQGTGERSPSAGGGPGNAVARADTKAPRRVRADDMVGNPLADPTVGGPGVVLDEAFDLLRFRFGRLVALAATVALPVQILSLVVSLRAGLGDNSMDAILPGSGVVDLGGGSAGPEELVLVALRVLGLSLLGIGVGHLASRWLEGTDATYGQVVRFVARRAWVAPVVCVAALAIKATAALLGGLTYVLGEALVFIASVVAGAEVLGPFAAVGRSIRLTRSAYGVALVVAAGGTLLTLLLVVALVLGPTWLLSAYSVPEGVLILVSQLGSLVVLVTMPLTACIAARAWVELRCRVEGDDLRRRAAERHLVPGDPHR